MTNGSTPPTDLSPLPQTTSRAPSAGPPTSTGVSKPATSLQHQFTAASPTDSPAISSISVHAGSATNTPVPLLNPLPVPVAHQPNGTALTTSATLSTSPHPVQTFAPNTHPVQTIPPNNLHTLAPQSTYRPDPYRTTSQGSAAYAHTPSPTLFHNSTLPPPLPFPTAIYPKTSPYSHPIPIPPAPAGPPSSIPHALTQAEMGAVLSLVHDVFARGPGALQSALPGQGELFWRWYNGLAAAPKQQDVPVLTALASKLGLKLDLTVRR